MPERMTSRWYVRNYVKIRIRVGITRRKSVWHSSILHHGNISINIYIYNSDRGHIFRFISSALVDHHVGTKTSPTCLGVGFQDQAIREDAVAFMEPDLGMDLPRELFSPRNPWRIPGLLMILLYPSCVYKDINRDKKKIKPLSNIEEPHEKP